MAAGVRVDLGIEDEDVDVAAGGQDVVEAAVADVVCPAIAADDPDALLDERIGEIAEVAGFGSIDAGEFLFEGLDALALLEDALFGFLIGVDEGLGELLSDEEAETPDELAGVFVLLIDGEAHAEAEFRVVLEERVRPGGSAAVLVGAVRSGGQVAAVDGGA